MAKKSSRKGLIITLIVLFAVIAAAAAWFIAGRKDGPVLVSVEPAQIRTITQSVSAIGRLQPELMVKVSSEASGEIIFLGVRDGDTVNKGQLLVRIQPDIMETQLSQTRAATESTRLSINVAKAELDRTESDLKRINELYKKEYASKEELDRARAAYESASGRYAQTRSDYQRAQGALQQTQATASRTTIFSPMSGIVTYLGVESGEKVVGTAQMQGTEMMRIADLRVMNAWVDVDENDVAMISLGDTARVRIDALPDVSMRGIVYEISHSPKVSGQGTQEEVVNFQVRIRLIDKDGRMRPGMSCSVDIETETKSNVVSIPIQAVTVKQSGDQANGASDPRMENKKDAIEKRKSRPESMVWIYSNGTVQSRVVKTGISDDGFIEIVSGLKKDESIVTSPYQAISKLLKPGAQVRVEDPEARQDRFRRLRQEQ
ncbi:MAG: efflux RND transporter periplasmic adaptor subunit [Candidatus Kapabacteria bacterium]|nr:efflux RND transporter periplasmic adaptor subunit [Ignavibacteria bacterium]MBP6509620.1 efflux RND transporter periplasmic adaptor subunit [Candidatus Kapabacteria bacterium]MBK6417588.1 efflux RND transporter periplasmic adaptor subunit [Ignavibacteria bacterium]MBK6761440.1 efflux RND transporter periplasmic adaptor subunit [Ignavibacteria bacterium]MBK7033462.1 efflux RND transporter periplasmic adaptor subunit [Ignavibacteria bacterium]